MGFTKAKGKEIANAMNSGDLEKAAQATVHAILEGADPKELAEAVNEGRNNGSK